MDVHLDYVPTDKQRMFHNSKAKELLFGGAAGGGKTKATVMDALLRCLNWDRTHAFVFRRTYTELEDTVIKQARESYPKELATYNSGRHEYALTNGSYIHFRHCSSPEDRFNYRGAEIQWLYFDELTSFEEEIYTFLQTRLRSTSEQDVKPVTRSSSNPGDIGHGWVKKRFVDPAPYMSLFTTKVYSSQLKKWRTHTTQYIPSLATENPYITDDYLFELEQKPDALRRALLFGDWDAFEGQVFSEFVNDPTHYIDRLKTHVITPFPVPVTWPRYMSFDHGYSKPFSVGWWAIGPDGCAYRYREWYGCEKRHANVGIKFSPRQIAEGIVERESEDEARENIVVDRIADPNIFERSRGDSIAQQMEPMDGRSGVYFRKGDNARIAGKMQLHERLRLINGKPLIYVFSSCPDWIRTVPNLPYDPKKPEDVDTDAEDHAYDDTRYFCMARPAPERVKLQPKPKPFDPYRRK